MLRSGYRSGKTARRRRVTRRTHTGGRRRRTQRPRQRHRRNTIRRCLRGCRPHRQRHFPRSARPRPRRMRRSGHVESGRRNLNPDRTPLLSRPLEDCEGRPALAGVRNLRLDDPSAGCSDLHRNFGVRSIWARRAAAARRAGSLKRGCTGRTVRRAEWQGLASAWHVVAIMRRRGRVHGRPLKLRVRRPWLVVDLERGRDEQATTRRGAPFQPALEQRPDPGLTAWGLEGGVAHFGSKKCPQRPPRLCEALQNH